MDRPDTTDAELDVWADELRAALSTAENALAEAARLVPTLQPAVSALASRGYAGSYEPRWRGIARPLVHSPAFSVDVVTSAGRTLLAVPNWKTGPEFRDPSTGDIVAAFPAPWPRHARAFADDHGLAVLTADGPRRGGGHRGPLTLWRHDGQDWSPRLIGPRIRPWPLLPAVRSVAAGDGEFYVGLSGGGITRHDSRTGTRLGPPLRVPDDQRFSLYGGPVALATVRGKVYRLDFTAGRAVRAPIDHDVYHRPAAFRLGGRPCLAVIPSTFPPSEVWRISDAVVEPPIKVPSPYAVCAYELGGRPVLAIASDVQIYRYDAETAEPVGPALTGHRRPITGITAGTIDGRPTLFSADRATIRRWDAATGAPWPAAAT
jgi:hypothetical protein